MKKNAKKNQYNIDIQDTSTWKKYSPKLCKSCVGTCCTFMVEVTDKDLENLGYIEEDEAQTNLKKVIKDLKSLNIIQRYNSRSDKFILQQRKNGDCIFLNSQRTCSVYEKRPEVCKQHPKTLGPKIGYCPYIPKDK